MKKLILVVGMVTAISFIACKKRSESQITPKELVETHKLSEQTNLEKLKSNPEIVGQIHNEVMDLVYDKLISITEAPTEEELQAIVRNEIKVYFNDYFSEDVGENYISNFMNSFSIIPPLPELSEEQNLIVTYAQRMEGSANPSLNNSVFNNLIDSIINSSNSDSRLSNDSKLMIAMIGSVYKSSNQYWKDNSQKWDLLGQNFNLSEASKLQPGYVKRVLKADGFGALRGAIAGGISGLGLFSVPFAVVGALVGACISSSATGIREYFGYTSWWPF